VRESNIIKNYLLSMGLRRKLVLSTSGVIVLLGLVTSLFVYFNQTRSLTEALHQKGITITRNLAANAVDPILTQNIIKLQYLVNGIVALEKDALYVYILDSNNSVRVHTFERGMPSALPGVNIPQHDKNLSVKSINTEEGYIRDIAVPLFQGLGTAHVGMSETGLRRTVTKTIWTLLGMTIVVTALGLIVVSFIAGRILKPLNLLSEGAEKLGDGNLNYNILVYTKDEVGKFAKTFNKMADNLFKVNAELQESEEKFRVIGTSVQDAIIMVNDEGNIIFWNPSAEKIFGYTQNEAVGRQLQTLIISGKYREAHEKSFSIFNTTGQGANVGKITEWQAVRKEGEEFPIELSLSSVKIKDKWNAIGIVRDISARKQAQEKLIRQSAELKDINADLSMLYKVSSALSLSIDINELFDIILQTMTGLEFINFEKKGGIFLIQEDRMVLASHLGHSEPFLELHKGMRVGDCLCGLAAKNGEIIISENCHGDSRHTIKPAGMLPHGHVILPLHAGNKVIGVLYLYVKPDIKIDEDKLKLLGAIAKQLGIAIDNARLHEETKISSLQDPLTGLANRRILDVELKRNVAMAKRLKQSFSVIMLDIDYFKKYNDTHGHPAGDKLLIEIANVILKEIREIDLAVRYGGEEFLILLPETALAKASEAAERLRIKVEERTSVTISLGIASYNTDMEKEELIKKADEALYQAKHMGRNRVEVSS